MSTHEVLITAAKNKRPHPNADSLSIIDIGSYTTIVRTDDVNNGDLGIYVEPDYMVDTGSDFSYFRFLYKEGKPALRRITATKLRGLVSYGLFIKLVSPVIIDTELKLRPVKEGDNVMDLLGITRYLPPMTIGNTTTVSPKLSPFPDLGKFDLENIQKKRDELFSGELVYITSKLHGCNSRYAYVPAHKKVSAYDGTTIHEVNERFWCGSRNLWMTEDDESIWTKSATPEMKEWCRAHPNVILYGEIVGPGIQSLQYGLREPTFFAFAAYDVKENRWFPFARLTASLTVFEVRCVPILYVGPFGEADYKALAEKDDALAAQNKIKQLCEGVVITPMTERYEVKGGRVSYKHVSDRYLLS